MNIVAQGVGWVAIVIGGWALLAVLAIGVARLCNRAVWMVVDSYGGLKTLQEFRDWYVNKDKK